MNLKEAKESIQKKFGESKINWIIITEEEWEPIKELLDQFNIKRVYE